MTRMTKPMAPKPQTPPATCLRVRTQVCADSCLAMKEQCVLTHNKVAGALARSCWYN